MALSLPLVKTLPWTIRSIVFFSFKGRLFEKRYIQVQKFQGGQRKRLTVDACQNTHECFNIKLNEKYISTLGAKNRANTIRTGAQLNRKMLKRAPDFIIQFMNVR